MLDEYGWIPAPRVRHEGRCRPNVAEHLAMSAPDLLPIFDIGHIHPGAHDVRVAGAGLLERAADIAQCLNRLGVGITGADDRAARVSRCLAGNVDDATDSTRTGLTNGGLHRAPAG